MNKIIIFIFVYIFFAQDSFAQRDTTVVERDPGVLMGFTNFGGIENIRFGLQNGKSLEWTNWKVNLSGVSAPFTNFGTALFTTELTEGKDYLVRNVSIPNWTQRYFSMIFLGAGPDVPRCVLLDASQNIFNSKNADFDDFVTYVAGPKTSWRTLTYSAHITSSILDLVLDWDRIYQHWEIPKYWPFSKVTLFSYSQLKVHPFWGNNTIGFNATIKW